MATFTPVLAFILSEYKVTKSKIIVTASRSETIKELEKPIVRRGKPVPGQKTGFKID